jgi:hypothetical protein
VSGQRDETPVAARADAIGDPFDRRLGGAARDIEAGGKIDRQMGGVGKPVLEMRGEAIARNHVEADAGHQRHSGPLRLGVAREEAFEHVDLPGDVEIMRALPKTRVGDRPRRGGERAGGVEDDGNTFQRGVDFFLIGEIEGPPGQVEPLRNGLQHVGVSAGEHGARPLRPRLARDELAGVAGRAVKEDASRHFAPLQPAHRQFRWRKARTLERRRQSGAAGGGSAKVRCRSLCADA